MAFGAEMVRKNRISLQTIADEVGLSKYAVSRSLAGKSGVSEETRLRISTMAERLGYVKPELRTTSDVAVLFYDLDPVNSELHVQYQSGIQAEAQRLEIGVRIHWMHDADGLPELLKRCSGILLVGPHSNDTIASIAKTNLPVVRIGWPGPLEQADVVMGTDHEGGQAVLEYLISLGHRSIVYVYGAPIYRGRHERYYGAREVAERHSDVTLHPMQFEEAHGFAKAFCDLQKTDFRPTAFFCSHDGLALTVISELLGQGYRVPDDVSVVGYGNYSVATQIAPALTTVKTNGQESGAVALRLLNERIQSSAGTHQAPARRVQIVATIIERRSTAPVIVPQPSV
jgi:LacI family transcriptional regulator